MIIALMGAPGAGKGTQARRLADHFKWLQLSTADLFRTNLQKQTDLGKVARSHMAEGDLVPDEVVDAMIEQWLRRAPANASVVFNGYPRTTYQAEALEAVLAESQRSLDAMVYLEVPDEEAVARLSGRMVCGQCLLTFAKDFVACNGCPQHRCYGEHLQQREEDQPALSRQRLTLFHRASGALLQHYQKSAKLVIVPGSGSESEVAQRLIAVVHALEAKHAPFASAADLVSMRSRVTGKAAAWPGRAGPRELDLVLVGGPGSGKGTRAVWLSERLHIPHIATGDLFRDNLKRETPLGKMARVYMDRGELVPDDVTDGMVQDRLKQADTKAGFILDGYPRNLHQAETLDAMLQDMGRNLAGVLHVNVSDAEIVARLSGRLTCRGCQTPYHLRDKPPAKPGVCDRCGGELYQRADDNAETVTARLRTFHAQTEPVIDYYRRKGLVVDVPGSGEVAKAVAAALEAVQKLTAR